MGRLLPLAFLAGCVLAACALAACTSPFGLADRECRVTGTVTLPVYYPHLGLTLPTTFTTSWCASPMQWMCYDLLDAPGADSARVMWQSPVPGAPSCRIILDG